MGNLKKKDIILAEYLTQTATKDTYQPHIIALRCNTTISYVNKVIAEYEQDQKDERKAKMQNTQVNELIQAMIQIEKLKKLTR